MTTLINEEARKKAIETLREELKRLEEYYREKIDEMDARWNQERLYIETLISTLMYAEKPEDIMKITCFGNIGYCCGLEKDCPMRNIVMEILNIPEEEYKEIKELFGLALIDPDKRAKLKEFLKELVQK